MPVKQEADDVFSLQHDEEDFDDHSIKYLVYHVANEFYASPLLSIREVIKLPAIKRVPYMKDYFCGVFNLRGQIVSVIDLRKKFKKEHSETQGLIIVVDSPSGPIGAIVDDVMSVADFTEEAIDRNPNLKTDVPMEFFEGIADDRGNLVNIIDIASCLGSDEMKKISELAAQQAA